MKNAKNDALQRLIDGLIAENHTTQPEIGENYNPYEKYKLNPCAFFTDVLRERLTKDIEKMIESFFENKITIGISATGTGKSWCAARLAIMFYKIYDQSQIYISSAPPIGNLERILWGELSNVVLRHPKLFYDDVVTKLSVKRTPLQFIQGVAIPTSSDQAQLEARFSGRHAPNLAFIFDEADAIPEAVYRGVDGCMSGGNARQLLMFNPRGSTGYVPSLISSGKANVINLSALNHPNVIRGDEEFAKGAVNREVTLHRIHDWTREVKPNEEKRETDNDVFRVPDYLVGRNDYGLPELREGLRVITNPQFNYMVLGRFNYGGTDQLIEKQWVDNARFRYDKYIEAMGDNVPFIKPSVGVDVGEYGADESCVCVRYGSLVRPFYSWNGVDVIETARRTHQICVDVQSSAVYVDGNGVGAGVSPTLTSLGINNVNRIMVQSAPSKLIKMYGKEQAEFYQLRDELWWSVREWLRTDENAMLPPDQQLIEELIGATYKEIEGKIKICSKDEFRKKIRRSPNRADALCLTFAPKTTYNYVEFDTWRLRNE